MNKKSQYKGVLLIALVSAFSLSNGNPFPPDEEHEGNLNLYVTNVGTAGSSNIVIDAGSGYAISAAPLCSNYGYILSPGYSCQLAPQENMLFLDSLNGDSTDLTIYDLNTSNKLCGIHATTLEANYDWHSPCQRNDHLTPEEGECPNTSGVCGLYYFNVQPS